MVRGSAPFAGREEQLRALERELDSVRSTGRGRFVLIRGRRRVGKSRLAEEFLGRTQPPNVFFSATKGRSPSRELALFAEQVAGSDLPAASTVRAGARFETWDAALAIIGSQARRTLPAVVVIDELPYLIDQDTSVEGALQTAWDRHLQDAPVLLIVIGSDVSMMTALTEHRRPLFGRPTTVMHLLPLSPTEVASMVHLEPAAALDAYLVVGGFPLLVEAWGRTHDVRTFLTRELTDPTSPLIVSGERMVAAEFPADAHPRLVLSAIGAGETTFTAIGQAAGTPRQSLERALDLLVRGKGVVEKMLPLSSRPSRHPRYFVADTYLRFWLRFIDGGLQEIERGRGRVVVDRVLARWPEFRGKAVEPLIRDALGRMVPSTRFGDARFVGGYWTRGGGVEVDLVGAARESGPRRVDFVGSIKWRDRSPFDQGDLSRLMAQRTQVPGADERTLLVGVSRSGFKARGLDLALGPADLLAAWS